MVSARNITTLLTAIVLVLGTTVAALGQTSASAVSGFNLGLPPGDPIDVDYLSGEGHYQLQVDLIFDPSAPPMEKHFQSPTDSAGGRILLDGSQPFPQPLWEDFLLVDGPDVSDWHEEIITPGWEWLLPGDPRIPDVIPDPFPPNESLITKDGQPWPWQPIPMPAQDPSKVWVQFPPIPKDHVLDVHKALLWVGTPGNRVWGDDALDDGTGLDESFIRVIEYPTPEPGSLLLLSLGGLMLLVWRRRSS